MAETTHPKEAQGTIEKRALEIIKAMESSDQPMAPCVLKVVGGKGQIIPPKGWKKPKIVPPKSKTHHKDKVKPPRKKKKEKVDLSVSKWDEHKSIYGYMKYLIDKHLINAIEMGAKERGSRINAKKLSKEIKLNFARWLMAEHSYGKETRNSLKANIEHWRTYMEETWRFLKKKVPARFYIGVKKAMRELTDYAVSKHGQNLHAAAMELRQDVEDGGDGLSMIEEVALKYGLNPNELSYFWKKVIRNKGKVQLTDEEVEIEDKLKGDESLEDKTAREVKEKELTAQKIEKSKVMAEKAKQEFAAKAKGMTEEERATAQSTIESLTKEVTDGEDRLKLLDRIIQKKQNMDAAIVKELNDLEERLRGYYRNNEFKIDPDDYDFYIEQKEEKEKAKQEEEAAEQPSEEVQGDPRSKFKSAWEAVHRFLPRAFAERLEDWKIVWDYSVKGVGEKLVVKKNERQKALVFHKGGERRIWPDAAQKEFIAPYEAHKWPRQKIMDQLIDAAARAFFYDTGILRKGTIPKFLTTQFITSHDVDMLIEMLNAIFMLDADDKAVEKLIQDRPGLKPVEVANPTVQLKKERSLIEELEQELQSVHSDSEKVVKWHSWWAENGGHFTTLFRDKRMIPLFQKWTVDVIRARVFRRPIPASVPYPMINFINKLSALDHLHQYALNKLAEIRFELARNAPEEEALNNRLLALSKDIRRRVRWASKHGIPKRLLPS